MGITVTRPTTRPARRRATAAALALALATTGLALTAAGGGAAAGGPPQEPGQQACTFRDVPRQLPPHCSDPGDLIAVVDEDGRHLGGVVVPAEGEGAAGTAITVDGQGFELVVENPVGGDAVTEHESAALERAVSTTGPGKCDDNAFNHYWSSQGNRTRWETQFRWYFKSGSQPGYLTQAQAVSAITTGTQNITQVNTNCNLGDNVSATQAYAGTTTSSANISASRDCQARDGVSVSTFGDTSSSTVLAWTCLWWTLQAGMEKTVESDVRFDKTDFAWWIPGVNTCVSGAGMYSLPAVTTHERGHTFGLDHVAEDGHGYLTMSSRINSDCSNFESNLGLGDIRGLEDLY